MIRGTISETLAGGTLNNSATATSPTAGQNSVTTGSVTATVPETAELAIAKTADKAHYLPGDTITYRISVTNSGPGVSRAPVIIDQVPQSVAGAHYSVGGAAPQALPASGAIALSDIPPGGAAYVTVTGTVMKTTGSLSNTAIVSSATPGKNGQTTPVSATTPNNPSITDTADLTVTKKADKTDYPPNDTIIYTISVTNNGPAAVSAPRIDDAVPAGVQNPMFSVNNGATWSLWTGSATLSDIAVNATSAVLIRGTVAPAAAGSLSNTATVWSDTPGTDGRMTPITATTPDTAVIPISDLKTTATADNANPKPGDMVTTTVSVRNDGPSTAHNPTVSYTPPPGLTGVEYSTDGGLTYSPWPGTVALHDIPGGETEKVRIRGRISPDAEGTLDNMFTAMSPAIDPYPADNSAKTVIAVTPVSSLVTTVTTDNANPRPGDTVTTTVSVRNDGPSRAPSPTVSYTPPPNLSDVEYSADGVNWSPWPGSAKLNDIASGATESVRIRGKISPDTAGSLDHTFTATSPSDDPNAADNSVTTAMPVVPVANLVTAVTPDKENPLPGDDLTYRITVTNKGPATASQPEISFAPPRGLTGVEYSTDGVTWMPWLGGATLPDIPNGSTTTLLVKGKVDGEEPEIRSSVTTKSLTEDPYTSDNTVTTHTAVQDTARLSLIKTADKAIVKPGETIIYTITVVNGGPAVARTPTVSDMVPAALENPQFSHDGGFWAPWTGSAELPDIAVGGRASVMIRGTLARSAAGDISNTATVTSPTPGPDGTNTPVASSAANTPVVRASDLVTTVTPDNLNPLPGAAVTYTVNVHNNGPATANTPAINAVIDPNLSGVEYSADGVNWSPWTGSATLSDIPDGSDSRLLIRGKVFERAAGTLTSVFATVNSDDPALHDNTVTSAIPVAPTSDLMTTVTSNNDAPVPGDIVTYTVTVKNNGPADAHSPSVDFGAPPLLGNIQYSTDGGNTWQPWAGSVALPDIPNGASSQVLIRGEVPVSVASDISHTITSRSDNADPSAANNTAVVSTTVTPTADLVTTVTADNANPKPGDNIVYTANVHNNGPSAATAPTVSFNPPSSLTNVEYSADGGMTYLPWPGSVGLPDIPNGGDAKVLIRGRVSDTPAETIEMVLAATSPASDPNSVNNTATVKAAVEVKNCTVTYYVCGQQFASQTVPCGTPAAMPMNPMRRGYAFAGWFTAYGCSGCPWCFTAPVAGNMALYAKWRPCR